MIPLPFDHPVVHIVFDVALVVVAALELTIRVSTARNRASNEKATIE
jgi:hypothetical protein